VVDLWSAPLPPGTSAQKAKLIALAEALERAEGKRVTVYTDSRYVALSMYMVPSIGKGVSLQWKERSYVTFQRSRNY
jgi:ribonuclease HI